MALVKGLTASAAAEILTLHLKDELVKEIERQIHAVIDPYIRDIAITKVRELADRIETCSYARADLPMTIDLHVDFIKEHDRG